MGKALAAGVLRPRQVLIFLNRSLVSELLRLVFDTAALR